MPQLIEGSPVYIKGSGAKPYELKNVGGVYSCSCPAWRNQSAPIDRRTCKHLKKHCGDAAELARIGGTPTLGAMVVQPQTQVPAQTQHNGKVITASAEYAQQVLDRAAAEGRSLRQDEKAKLHGPPVLLAHSFEDSEINPTGWWYSEKLDGVRAYWDGQQFISRQGNIFFAPDWFRAGLPDHPLDGELWIGRQMFQKTISVVKRQDWGEGAKQVKYLVWDLPHLKSPFEERQEALEAVLLASQSKILKAVQQDRCTGIVHLKQELDRLVAFGAEGLMIRQPGSLYEAQRSNTLLKVKPFKDDEGTVIAHKPGKGRHKGRLGAVVVQWNSVEFDLGTGFTDEDRRNPPTIGARVTFRYTETTEEGKPKCASFIAVREGY